MPPPACYADYSVDLARSGAGSASSAIFPVQSAFDDNAGSRWLSEPTDPGWLEIAWQTSQAVCEVVISWEAAQAAHYYIKAATAASATSGTL